MTRLLLSALLLAACCATNSQMSTESTAIAAWGFHELAERRDTVEASISDANAMLGPNATKHLRPSWMGSASSDNLVPVYVVARHERGSFGPCFVLPDVNAILVDAGEIEPLRTLFGWRESGADPTKMLSVLLLHELAHIANGDNKSAHYFLPQDPSHPNRDDNETKRQEEAADSFAARIVRSAASPGHPAFAVGILSVTELGMASFYLSAKSMVDDFGAPPAKVYWDASYTHPNLGLRLIYINLEVSLSEESRRLSQQQLEQFLTARRGSGSHFGDMEESVHCMDGCGCLGLAFTKEAFEEMQRQHSADHPGHRCKMGGP